MDAKSAKVLIIEDNQGDAFLVNEFLIEAGYNAESIIIENTLKGGLEKLSCENISIILTDLGLPDSNREDTINSIINENAKVPIIILSGVDDIKIATDSVNNGVQDYLIKGKFDAYILLHSIQYSLLRFENKQKLKELSEFKSKLFRIVSHDLKGPMGALYTYIEMMVEDFEEMPKEDIKQDLTCLEEISKSLLNLIENLFSWARVQVGSIEIKPELINVNDLVIENIRVSKLQAGNKNISIKNNIPAELTAFADLDMINTVIRNLIFNAIKFTNVNGCIKIEGSTKNGLTKISVSDNGIGMESKIADQIFSNCQVVNRSGTNNEKGSGLGLSLCKEFVESNNGKIWVDSVQGEGSTFSFSLPNANVEYEEKKMVSLLGEYS